MADLRVMNEAFGDERGSPDGRYRVVKEIITDPYAPCLSQQVHLEGDPEFLRSLHVYALAAPHLEVAAVTIRAVGQGTR